MDFPLDAFQVIELLLVGTGALAYLHLVLARSTSTRTLWFNGHLYAWALCWTVWFASVFSSLNLEAISYDRFPWISMATDLLKGAALNLQAGFLLHGLVRWTGRGKRIPRLAWYLPPLAVLALGAWRVALHPMDSFLSNVEHVVRAYLCLDILSNAAAIAILTAGMGGMDHSQISVARPLRKAFFAMIPLSAAALALKLQWGFSGPGRYRWVILHDLCHLAPPAALIWATYATESVALSVARSAWRRAGWLALAFGAYMALKALWPLSELDRVASFSMAAMGLVATLGPLSMDLGRKANQLLNWELANESAALNELDSKLWDPGLAEEDLPRRMAESVATILKCRAVVLPESDPRIQRILAHRGGALLQETRPLALQDATSRAEVQAWEELGGRTLLLVHSDPAWVVALGKSTEADPLPAPILDRLGGLQSTCQRVLRSRRQLRDAVESQRRLQESERLAMLGLLSASAAHEIKNPLSAIRNVASAALRDAPPDSVLQRDLTVVVGEVDRLDTTVRRMLLFARDRDTCKDAAETIHMVVGLLAAEARHRGLRLQVECSGTCAVAMSENDLKAILFNLIQNAMAHAPKGSVVEVRFRTEGPTLEVENQGEIPADFLPRLFRPLASQSGTGLGLYISRDKARQAGANLEHLGLPGRTQFRLQWGNA